MLSVGEDVFLRPLGHRDPDRMDLLRIDVGELRNDSGLAQTELVRSGKTPLVFHDDSRNRALHG